MAAVMTGIIPGGSCAEQKPSAEGKGARVQPASHRRGHLSPSPTEVSGGPLVLPTRTFRAAARVRRRMRWSVLATFLSLCGPWVLTGQLPVLP